MHRSTVIRTRRAMSARWLPLALACSALAALAALAALPAQAADNAAKPAAQAKAGANATAKPADKPTLADVIQASKPSDWRPLDPASTLYMELPGGRVVIELAPAFAPNTVANIRALTREHYYDGLAVLRSQDNFVAQWGDPDEKNPKPVKTAKTTIKAEFTVPISAAQHFARMPDFDGYAPQVGHADGFPAARDPKKGITWLAHCYGMVGVGRDNDPDSGSGVELYAVTGHAPRQLDRNITVVGRVVAGMPLLASLPRGTGPLGFYEQPEQRTPIKSVRLAADVPEAERSHLEVMRTETAAYRDAVEAQRNRGGDWYKVSANYIELCNAPIPVREQPQK